MSKSDCTIDIPVDESEKMVRIGLVLSKEFPAAKEQILDVVKTAREGITISLSPVVHPHTHRQRNYYWKWLRAFAEFCGTTPDETHQEILCQTYGTEFVETKFGIKRRAQKRSSEATRPEYTLLIDTLTRTAAEMGFDVPPPISAVQ